MENLILNTGMKEYDIGNGAVLRFNPSDPAMYERYLQLVKDMKQIGTEMSTAFMALSEENKANEAVAAISSADHRIKKSLAHAFGEHNDFDAIFGGVSSFAGTDTGEWVITNFINAITPIIKDGANRRLQLNANAAKLNREQRRAAQK